MPADIPAGPPGSSNAFSSASPGSSDISGSSQSGSFVSSAPLRVEGVSRAFGALAVLEDINMTVSTGEFVALVGPSGCGKTTLLNLLSGADTPTSGRIARPGHVRMVYQQDGLLPWLTVGENIALGVRGSGGVGDGKTGKPKDTKDRLEKEQTKVAGLLQMIGLEEFAASYPYQLSGGMRQRVELARALGSDTDLLLLDEPFSALDYLKRLELRQSLAELLRQRPAQVVLVTHDVEEACQLADRVLVLSGRPGHIQCEISIVQPRPRPAMHPDVVAAMQRVLAEMGLQNL